MIKNLMMAACVFSLAPNMGALWAKPATIAGAQSFDLSAKLRHQLEVNAYNGNAEAALQLSKFYSFVRNDVKSEVKWLKRAAELGNAEGQYTLGYVLLHDEENCNLLEAERWLMEAEISAGKRGDEELLSFVKQTQRDLQKALSRK